ncbi:MAG TPA: DUF1800 family protein [Anaerolineales bacterium]
MSLSRRDFLKLSALVTASAALSGCGPLYRLTDQPIVPWEPLAARDFMSLSRLTFGPRTEERARLAQVGLQAWIEEQLAPDSIDDPGMLLHLRSFKTLGMEANELEALSNQLFENYDRESIPGELRRATLLRQVYSRRQLYEVMVEFWSDHFNITTEKGNCFFLKTVDDREVIRKHALGSFRDLVWASAHSPAMLVYLDNQANEKGAPNENYARELMKLHTLSVNGGYSQQDVMELARCLTGWTVKNHFWLGDFTFNPDLHDTGIKRVLDLIIPNEGQREAERVIEKLIADPSTARFVATKLARRFIADEPTAEIVEKATRAFLQTQGDIKSVLRVILLDGLSLGQPKYKRPANFVVSALRMLEVQTDGHAMQDHLMRMGQTYFGWATPDGYPDRAAQWQGSLMPRWQFAFELVRNELGHTKTDLRALMDVANAHDPAAQMDALTSLLLGAPLAASARDELIGSVTSAGANADEALAILAGGILASPAFQWR